MSFHDEPIRTRQDDLLREAAALILARPRANAGPKDVPCEPPGMGLFAAVERDLGNALSADQDGGRAGSVPVLVFARVGRRSLLLPLAIRRGQLRCWLPAGGGWRVRHGGGHRALALLSAAERRLSSSMAGLLMAAVPIIGSVWPGWPVAREPLTAVRWAGLAGRPGGVALLAGRGTGGRRHLARAAWYSSGGVLAVGPVITTGSSAAADGLGVTAVCLAATASCTPRRRR